MELVLLGRGIQPTQETNRPLVLACMVMEGQQKIQIGAIGEGERKETISPLGQPKNLFLRQRHLGECVREEHAVKFQTVGIPAQSRNQLIMSLLRQFGLHRLERCGLVAAYLMHGVETAAHAFEMGGCDVP